MHATGGAKLIKRPNSLAFTKHNSRPESPNKDVFQSNKKSEAADKKKDQMRPHTAISKTPKLNLVSVYKQCAFKSMQKIHPSVIYPLKYNREL